MPFRMNGFINKSQSMSTKPGAIDLKINPTGFTISATNPLLLTVDKAAVSDEEKHKQEYEKARRALESAIESIKDTSSPTISIEGISIASGESPVTENVASSNATVSIVNDPSDESVLSKIQQTSIGPHPVILSAVKVPNIRVESMDDAIEVNQFERQIAKEAMTKGLKDVLSKDPKGTGSAAKKESAQQMEDLSRQISALSYMQETANMAASGLDITKLSGQIMQRASDALGPIIVPSELSNKQLPTNLDEYISLTFPTEDLKLGIDGYLTNTSRLIVLAQDMMLAALSCHPTVLQHFSRRRLSSQDLETTSVFSPPGAYGYDPDGEYSGNNVSIPTVSQLFAPNRRSIVSQFQASKSIASARDTIGILNLGTSVTVTEAWDAVLHLVTCISNEMILSAGTGRVVGSPLGTRFLQASSENIGQYNPFDRVFGISPTAGSDEISKFYTSGPKYPGSFLDYLALGEEENNARFVVMPFETNTVSKDGKYYVAGRKYFIDLAIQSSSESAVSQRGALRRFASDIRGFTNDMASYLTEMLALDVNTSLAPQTLLSRVLQDFSTVLSALDRPETAIDPKSATAAALLTLCGYAPDETVSFDSDKSMSVSASDITKMSVIKALKELDRLSKDSTFALSNKNTEYETVSSSPGDNPELNLEKAIISLSGRNGVDKTPLRVQAKPTKTSRVKYGFTKTDALHDSDFSSSTNIINLLARTIRETQKEALNLSQRNGAKIDYRNSGGGTYLSNCDDDRFIDVVCELYSRIAYLLLPLGMSYSRESFEFVVDITPQSVISCAAVVSSIVTSLTNGEVIDPDSIQFSSLVDPGTRLNAGEEDTITCTSADVGLAASRIVQHRYYIKSSLKILESVAVGVAASSSKMSDIFDILNGTVKQEKLKGLDLELFNMFVTNKAQNEELRQNISEQQTNLCTLSMQSYISSDNVFLRRDIDVSRSERLAVRDYIKSVYRGGNLEDLQILSVGLPAGMLESLYRTTISIDTADGQSMATLGSEGERRGRKIVLEVDRYDNVYFSSRGGVVTDVLGGSGASKSIRGNCEFDPEVFILPDSIQYDPETRPAAETILDSIVKMTTFYRIRNGSIIEKTTGELLEPSQLTTYTNALISYLLDIYLYETVKVRYLDGVSPYGAPGLTKSGYELIKQVSSDAALSRSVMNTPGFSKLFNEKTYLLSEGRELRSLLTPLAVDRLPEFVSTDVYFASILASMLPVAKSTGTIVSRPYERIYHMLYDESIVRNMLGSYEASASKRAQFDIYTLALRVSYGGRA